LDFRVAPQKEQKLNSASGSHSSTVSLRWSGRDVQHAILLPVFGVKIPHTSKENPVEVVDLRGQPLMLEGLVSLVFRIDISHLDRDTAIAPRGEFLPLEGVAELLLEGLPLFLE
jgi:hypothetical protein